jgi:hypothetical protein
LTVPVASAASSPARQASSAGAGSLVYVKAGNVFLSDTQGSLQYQVTADGSPGDPYTSPSQDTRGTIYAARHGKILRFQQNGATAGPPLSVSGALAGAISPGGNAYAYESVDWCSYRACRTTHVVQLPSGAEVAPFYQRHSASWIDGSTLLGVVLCGIVDYIRLGSSAPQSWVDDVTGPWHDALRIPNDPRGYFSCPETAASSADGTKVALRDGANELLMLLGSQGVGGAPLGGCAWPMSPDDHREGGVSVSADGSSVFWEQQDGIWSGSLAEIGSGCAALAASAHLLIPGASSPSYSAVAANPGALPRVSPPPAHPAPRVAPAKALLRRDKKSILIDLDSRYRRSRVAVWGKVRSKWVAVGTARLDVRGNAVVKIPKSRITTIRKGVILRIIRGRTRLAQVRLR